MADTAAPKGDSGNAPDALAEELSRLMEEKRKLDRRIGKIVRKIRKPENGGNGKGFQENLSYTLDTVGVHGVCIRSFARKLTPLECERLMGFPDNWTRISWRRKPPEECPDNHRYRACGNSMCVNVMRWIGIRIDMVDKGIDPNEM